MQIKIKNPYAGATWSSATEAISSARSEVLYARIVNSFGPDGLNESVGPDPLFILPTRLKDLRSALSEELEINSMAVLMALNERGDTTPDELVLRTGLSDNAVRRAIEQLSNRDLISCVEDSGMCVLDDPVINAALWIPRGYPATNFDVTRNDLEDHAACIRDFAFELAINKAGLRDK